MFNNTFFITKKRSTDFKFIWAFVLGMWLPLLGMAQVNDAGISEFLEPENPTNSYSYVQVTLTNHGTAPLNTVSINWTVNGKEQRPYEYAGPTLRPGRSIDLYIGGYDFNQNGTYEFEVFTSNPNGVTDENAANDRIIHKLKGELDLFEVDAGIVRILEPLMPRNSVRLIRVRIKNFGIEPIDSMLVNWRINGVAQIPYEYKGPRLRSRDEIDLYIGSYKFDINTEYTIRSTTSMPNGKVDEQKSNDSATTSF